MKIIIGSGHDEFYKKATENLSLPAPITGGMERRDSVKAGIESLKSILGDDEIVLIHDAARPFVSPQEIAALVAETSRSGAATLATPVPDTLRHEDGHYVDRNGLWSIQTPQGFRFGLLKEAHEKADASKKYTDDSSMVAALGHPVSIVPGSRRNFKITTAEDIEMARAIMNELYPLETRSASGFDVHAFAENSTGKKLRLCGVDIPFERELLGHSDADVGLHALTDALLGTISSGDIGHHFPPSDPHWKGVDSAVFLKHAVDLVKQKQGRIVNLDLTIIGERPKVGPYRAAMQSRVAEICDISTSRVSIKATTTEKLGFTGREEGIAAQALATIQMPAEDESDV